MNNWDFDLEINTVYDDYELTVQELLCKHDAILENLDIETINKDIKEAQDNINNLNEKISDILFDTIFI